MKLLKFGIVVGLVLALASPVLAINNSGSLTAASQAVTLNLGDRANGSFQITGTFSATVSFEATTDGLTWAAINATPPNSTTAVTSATSTGLWVWSGAFRAVRARVSAYTSGTAVITVLASPFGGGGSGGGAAGATQYNQGVAGGDTDSLMMAGAVRKDTAAVATGVADGDNTRLSTDAVGQLRVRESNIGTAAALADNTANPTVGAVAAFNMCWDGSTWDRCTTGATTDSDDGSVAAAQTSVALVLALPYSFDGTAWTRTGASVCKRISTASDNEVSCKAAAGVLYGISAMNINAAVRYLKIFNTVGAPTCGTDVPVITVMIPGNTAGSGVVIPIPPTGISFATGIGICMTTGIADNDNTNVAANEILTHLFYK